MKEFIDIITGNYNLAILLGFAWFFFIGYIINALIEVSGRDKESKHTPKYWNWKFWFHDNWKRYLLTILVTYIFFIFYNEISGHPFGNVDALTLGLLGDAAAAKIKSRFNIFMADREKLLKKYDV